MPKIIYRFVALVLAAALAAEPALASVTSDESRVTSPMQCLMLDSSLIPRPSTLLFASQALSARSVILPQLDRTLANGHPRQFLSRLLSLSHSPDAQRPRLPHPIFTGQPGNPGRALRLSDPLEEWLPTELIGELRKVFVFDPSVDARTPVPVRVARIHLQQLLVKEMRRSPESSPRLNQLRDLYEQMHIQILKRILEGRLVIGLTFEEAKEFHHLLTREATETEIAGSRSGTRLSVAFQPLPREFSMDPTRVDTPRRDYALRRVGKSSDGVIPLEIVPSEQIMGAVYEFDTEQLASGGTLRVPPVDPQEPRTVDPVAVGWVLLSMFHAISIYASDNGMARETVNQQIAANYSRIRIEIRKKGDRPEADLPWIDTPEGEKLDPRGTAVIIIPEKFIPTGRIDRAGMNLLDYIALSEWAGHFLDPYAEDLTEHLKGVEPPALWHFIRHVGYEAVIEALQPHAAASEFARRVVSTLRTILTENPALRPTFEVLFDTKASKALWAEQARFLYTDRGRSHFETIWGNGLLEKLSEESMMWISTPNGRRRRRTSFLNAELPDPVARARQIVDDMVDLAKVQEADCLRLMGLAYQFTPAQWITFYEAVGPKVRETLLLIQTQVSQQHKALSASQKAVAQNLDSIVALLGNSGLPITPFLKEAERISGVIKEYGLLRETFEHLRKNPKYEIQDYGGAGAMGIIALTSLIATYDGTENEKVEEIVRGRFDFEEHLHEAINQVVGVITEWQRDLADRPPEFLPRAVQLCDFLWKEFGKRSSGAPPVMMIIGALVAVAVTLTGCGWHPAQSDGTWQWPFDVLETLLLAGIAAGAALYFLAFVKKYERRHKKLPTLSSLVDLFYDWLFSPISNLQIVIMILISIGASDILATLAKRLEGAHPDLSILLRYVWVAVFLVSFARVVNGFFNSRSVGPRTQVAAPPKAIDPPTVWQPLDHQKALKILLTEQYPRHRLQSDAAKDAWDSVEFFTKIRPSIMEAEALANSGYAARVNVQRALNNPETTDPFDREALHAMRAVLEGSETRQPGQKASFDNQLIYTFAWVFIGGGLEWWTPSFWIACLALPFLFSAWICARLPPGPVASTRNGETTFSWSYVSMNGLVQSYIDVLERIHQATTRWTWLSILNTENPWHLKRPVKIRYWTVSLVEEFLTMTIAIVVAPYQEWVVERRVSRQLGKQWNDPLQSKWLQLRQEIENNSQFEFELPTPLQKLRDALIALEATIQTQSAEDFDHKLVRLRLALADPEISHFLLRRSPLWFLPNAARRRLIRWLRSDLTLATEQEERLRAVFPNLLKGLSMTARERRAA